MPFLVNKATGEKEYFIGAGAAEALSSGEWFSEDPNARIFYSDSQGSTFAASPEAAALVAEEGGGIESAESFTHRLEDARLEDEYGDGVTNTLLAGGAGVARGLSLGTSDAALRGLGVDAEALRELRGRHQVASIGGEIVGSVAPVLFTGGAGGAARLLAKTPAGIAASIGQKAGHLARWKAAGAANAGLLGKVAYATVPAAAQLGAEGALFGAGTGITEVALSDEPISSEAVLASLGGGALHGAAIGGVLGAGGAAAGNVLKRGKNFVQSRMAKAATSEDRVRMGAAIGDMSRGSNREIERELQTALKSQEKDLLLSRSTEKARLNELRLVERERLAAERATMGKEAREGVATLKADFKAEREALKAGQKAEKEALGKVLAKERDQIQASYKSQLSDDGKKALEMAERFGGEITDVYQTARTARQIIKLNADYLGMRGIGASKRVDTIIKKFESTFTKTAGKGRSAKQVVLAPDEMISLLGREPDAVRILKELEDTVVGAVNEQNGTNHVFDSLLSEFKETDELIKSAKTRLSSDEAQRLKGAVLEERLSLHRQDSLGRLEKLRREGTQGIGEVYQRERGAVDNFREVIDRQRQSATKESKRLKKALGSEELTKIDNELAGVRTQKQALSAEGKLAARADDAEAVAKASGIEISTLDKIAYANELGLDLGVIPEGSALDKVLSYHVYAKLLGHRGLPSAVAHVANKTSLGRSALGLLKTAATSKFMPAKKASLVSDKLWGRAGGKALGKISGGLVETLGSAKEKTLTLIKEGVGEFVKASSAIAPGAGAATINILDNVQFTTDRSKSYRAKVNTPNSILNAFRRRQEELNEMVGNPEALAKDLEDKLNGVAEVDPNLARQMALQTARKLQFIHSKMPQSPTAGLGQLDLWHPSETAIAKWARYIRAAEDPISVLKDMREGRLSHEAAETVAVVYPEVYDTTKLQLMEIMSEVDTVPYRQRQQVGILYNAAVDYSQQLEFMAAMQQNFTPTPPGPASEVNTGRLSADSIELSTPAQRTQSK